MQTYTIKVTNVREKVDNSYLSNKYCLKFDSKTDISYLSNPWTWMYEVVASWVVMNGLSSPILYVRWTAWNDIFIYNWVDSITNTDKEYLLSIAEWDIPDHDSFIKNWYNAALSTAEETLRAVWWDYVFPTAEMGMEIVSSSADDAEEWTWAQTVIITYLDSTFTEKTETVTLNGTTPVPTVADDIYRINNFRVVSAWSWGKNAWDIDIRHLTDTPIYSRIATGINRALNCVYTVPKDHCLYIYNVLFSSGANVANRPVRFITKATYDNINKIRTNFFIPYTNVIIVDGTCDVPIEIPTKYCEWVDIKVNAISPDGASYAAVTIRWWLEIE